MACATRSRFTGETVYHENDDFAPEALWRFRALRNIRKGTLTANGRTPEIKDSISRHALILRIYFA